MKSFAEYLYYLLPSALKRVAKKLNHYWILFHVLGRHCEEIKNVILDVREQSMILTCPDELLPVFGEERDMPRLYGEQIPSYRKRLLMKSDIAERAGTRDGIKLALSSLGYDKSYIEPFYLYNPERWAEFIVYLGKGNGRAVKDLAIIYQEILVIKQASSKPAYLIYTDNEPFNGRLMLDTAVSSYAKSTLNDADKIILVWDREFDSPLYAADILASYSETVLNSADDPMLTPNRSFDMPLRFSIMATSYKEELLQ